jgi:putative Holliday junction resolvase
MNETLLGIDYGSSKIGLALGRGGVVAPLRIISGKNAETAIYEISRLALENKVFKIVVGLPITATGKETNQTREVRKFADLLKALSKVPVVFQNEFGSTVGAFEEAFEKGYSQKGRRLEDHLAAALILKNYYEDNTTTK